MGIDADAPGTAYGIRMGKIFGHLNIQWFGAIGDGNVANGTINSDAIEAAVDAAFTMGTVSGTSFHGTTIYCPPGHFQLARRINNFNQGHAGITLRGAGRKSTTLSGSFPGYVIDKPPNGQANLLRIEDIFILNYWDGPEAGAIRFHGAQNGLINSCGIQGYNGVSATQNSYCTMIQACEISCIPVDGPTIGISIGQGGVYQCRIVGFDTGIITSNTGVVLSGNATEVCGNAMQLGLIEPVYFMASFNGTTMTITDHLGGYCAGVGQVIFGSGITVGTTIVSITSSVVPGLEGGTILEGVAEISTNPGVISTPILIGVSGAASVVHGCAVLGHQSEQCYRGISIISAAACSIHGVTLTGTVGPYVYTNSSLTRSATTVTVTTTAAHGMIVDQKVQIYGVTPSDYNGVWYVTAVPTDTTFQFTIGTTPADSSVHGSSQPYVQYGLRVRNAVGCDIGGIEFTGDFAKRIDLYYNNNTASEAVVFNGVNVGAQSLVLQPVAIQRSGFRMVNCDFYIPMNYDDLPGFPGNYNGTPIPGETWVIEDGQRTGGALEVSYNNPATPTFNAPSTTLAVPGSIVGDGGTQKLAVTYDGTDWICVVSLD